MRSFILCLLLAGALSAQTFTVPDFAVDTLDTPGYGTIALDFDFAGRLYVAEKRGRILVMTPDTSGGYNAPTEFADLSSFVYDTSESGLLGMALDPDFQNNRHIYIFYTTPSDQRLVRIEANASFTSWTSTQTVLLSGLPRNAGNHKAGDIDFLPGDPNNIYIMLGDDAKISLADNLDYYHGKILRVNKTNGQGLTSNPFYVSSTTDVRSRIWALGFRNPFRMAFHPNVPVANSFYFSENGGPGGVTNQDRFGFVQRGADGFWNTANSQAGTNSPFYSPVNAPGSECIVMQRDMSSLIGIAIAENSPFGDPAHPNSSTILVSNWLRPSGGSISRWRLTGSNLDTATPIAADGGQQWVTGLYATDMKFGPDGHLYFTQSGNGSSSGSQFRIGRIRYTGNQPPVASFNTSPSPAAGIAPLNVQFTDTSTAPGSSIASWHWDFGDGNTSTLQNPSHVYANPGQYTATLTVTAANTLQDIAQATVNVDPPVAPTASFTTNPSPPAGTAPLNVQFTDTSAPGSGSITAWHWDFGDGNNSTQQNPSHVYNADGSYVVTLTVTNSAALQDNAQVIVNVSASTPPTAAFTTSPSPAQGLAPLVVQFTDASTPGTAAIVAWQWDFGDGNGSSDQNPQHTYTTPGSYQITLTVTDAATLQDLVNGNVEAWAAPVAAFETSPAPATGRAPLAVQFVDTSTSGAGGIVSWQWEFGDGSNSSDQNPAHTYTSPGSYTVTLTVTDAAAQGSAQATVTVQAASKGDSDEGSGCALAGGSVLVWIALAGLAFAGRTRRRMLRRACAIPVQPRQ